MNTLAVWVPSCPSHVHYGSRGEPLRVCALVSLLYSQESHLSPLLQLTCKDSSISALERNALQKHQSQAKPIQDCLTPSCGCKQHQSLTGKAAGEGQLVPRYTSGCHDIRAEVPHQLWPDADWQQRNSPLAHSSHARVTGPMLSDLSLLSHGPHRASLSSMPSYCTWQGKILNPFCFSLSYTFPTDHCQALLPAFHSNQLPPAL